jgi:hypothetical protein
MGSPEAAVIIISNIPPRRYFKVDPGNDILALQAELLAVANDTVANLISPDLSSIAGLIVAEQPDWGAINVALTATGVTRPYVQQS